MWFLGPTGKNGQSHFEGIRVLLGCGGVLYSLCTEMPSTAHAPGLLSTPLAREYVCQKCGKALPPLGIEPLPPAPKARALKDRAIWTLVISHRYRGRVHIQYTLLQPLFSLRARTHYATFFFFSVYHIYISISVSVYRYISIFDAWVRPSVWDAI